ncbi:fibronectin type III domain-containing protein [Candidatus Uhrbacteria bacterium]|nr:fibronectin type III domain-containing protein [Candidatus Uhrbacteria bacterium]
MKNIYLSILAAALLLPPTSGFAHGDDQTREKDEVKASVEIRAEANGDVPFRDGVLPRGVQKRLENGKGLPPGIAKILHRLNDDDDDREKREDKTAPVISNVVAEADVSTAVIRWQTNELSRGSVSYRAANDPTSPIRVKTADGWSMSHQVELTNLAPDTTYSFFVGARDRAGNVSNTENMTFHTKVSEPVKDVTAPNIVYAAINARTATSARLFWVTNEASDSRVWVSKTSPVDIKAAPAVQKVELAFVHQLELTGLEPDTQYYVVMGSADATGNVGTREDRFHTRPAPVEDTTGPEIVYVAVSAKTATSAHIIWVTNEASDSRVWASLASPVDTSGAPAQRSAELSFYHNVEVTGLQPDKAYHFVVGSADASGNLTVSGEKTFETLE